MCSFSIPRGPPPCYFVSSTIEGSMTPGPALQVLPPRHVPRDSTITDHGSSRSMHSSSLLTKNAIPACLSEHSFRPPRRSTRTRLHGTSRSRTRTTLERACRSSCLRRPKNALRVRPATSTSPSSTSTTKQSPATQ
ncbi:hypothetical protein OH76DRAFT_429059 [Lentinus brumalis]|uniref:Uncharacterized protein n=1 Tax=Lentinus brumalis TaxID=2498619 RepID=A0A371DWJ4_9APHY|nr:hypothetical protein OH76DRAFT_429059 [Polyporus brumalis]